VVDSCNPLLSFTILVVYLNLYSRKYFVRKHIHTDIQIDKNRQCKILNIKITKEILVRVQKRLDDKRKKEISIKEGTTGDI